MTPAYTDRTDPAVIKALTRKCGCCHAPKNTDCRMLNGQPLPGGQIVHHHRAEKGVVAP